MMIEPAIDFPVARFDNLTSQSPIRSFTETAPMRFSLSLAALLFLATFATAQEKFRVYLGTYTGKVSKGIYQCELDLKDGSLSAATLAGETKDPSFLAIHPNKKFLYAVNEGQASVS